MRRLKPRRVARLAQIPSADTSGQALRYHPNTHNTGARRGPRLGKECLLKDDKKTAPLPRTTPGGHSNTVSYDLVEPFMKPAGIRAYLAGGDRRSIGRSDELVRLLKSQPARLPEVVQEMWSDDPLVAMRAADAVEKFTRQDPKGLEAVKKELLGLAEETSQQELRWHLAALMTRFPLHPAEYRRVVRILSGYLRDKSSIVKTFALQALFDLAIGHSSSRPQVEELLRVSVRDGTAAMRARCRHLLKRIEKGWAACGR